MILSEQMHSKLPEGWKVAPFADYVFFQEGPGIRNWQYADEGIPFVNIRCLVDGRLDVASMSKVSVEEAMGKYKHFLLDAKDYVVSSSGTIGRIAEVSKADLPVMLNTSVIRMRPLNESLDRVFLKQFLSSRFYQDQIEAMATGSAQLNYGPMHLKKMFILVPPIADQKKIAHILGTLDDKIELNRRMAATLEEMARALFKSWFVDFDPVRAKAEGRPTGLSPDIDALFPDELVESELGLIPKGWASIPLSEVLTESNERIGDISAPEYSSTNFGLVPRLERFNKQLAVSSAKNKLVKRGYLVFGMSRQILNFGLMRDKLGSVSSAYRVFKIDEKLVEADLVERIIRLKHDYFYNVVSSSSREGQSIAPEALKHLYFVNPPVLVQSAFYKVTTEYIDRCKVALCEAETLDHLKNLLLPRLISGEVKGML